MYTESYFCWCTLLFSRSFFAVWLWCDRSIAKHYGMFSCALDCNNMEPVTIILILFVAALILFATEWLPVDVTALCLLALLMLTGLLQPKEAFAGFGSDTVLTLASLFMLTQMLLRTGVINWLGQLLTKHLKESGTLLRALTAMVGSISAFTSNTATIAVFLPVVMGICQRNGINASRVLMSLAFASILGGTVTVIGTSTNLVVSGAIAEMGMEPLGFFELAWVGLPVLMCGLLYLFFVAPRILPERDVKLEEHLREYLSDLSVAVGSPLVGQTLRSSRLMQDYQLNVVVIRRGQETIYAPHPDFRIEEGDTLVVEGSSEQIVASNHLGVFNRCVQRLQQTEGLASDVRLVEAVVLSGSSLLGRTLREAQFRERYGLSVLALHRRDRATERLARQRLRVGDVLLIQGSAARIAALDDQLVMLGEVNVQNRDTRRAPLALCLFGSAILAGACQVVPLVVAVVVAVALALVLGLITPNEAYSSVEWPVIVLVAGMFAFGSAFESSGAVQMLSQILSDLLRSLGPLTLLGILMGITVLLTQPMSNQAAALVMLPLALGTSEMLGYNPRPFVVGIALAASNSFITPLEPACLLVYGPGRYTFMDFVRVGTGLTLLSITLALIIIPKVWPF